MRRSQFHNSIATCFAHTRVPRTVKTRWREGADLPLSTDFPSELARRVDRQTAQLRRGREFERQVQSDWARTAEGNPQTEVTIPLLSGLTRTGRRRHGRMDVFVSEAGDMVTIVEIKATDWDRILPRHIQNNLSSHRRQVWRYIEKHLDADRVDVCAGIIYPRAPKTPGLKERVEEYLNGYGLQVVWYCD